MSNAAELEVIREQLDQMDQQDQCPHRLIILMRALTKIVAKQDDELERLRALLEPPRKFGVVAQDGCLMAVNVNGKTVEIESPITYEKVVAAADSGRSKECLHTITYRHKVPFVDLPGEREGTIHPGSKPVVATMGMVISAYVTDNA